ncbi:MAG: glutamate racemase [Candidatus Eisenbacteria bacterium]|uniref:Glutamate racemase n=1 Tax=Eiseniibacteriota bacterium TaxID=2212470 RepID=A0A948RVH9_UNCEI|nr:glutamate racemase [Candidatus Eisenbacteria bacterium]MBU1951171.1 glutamate racemase [Candidatus Eisenbacteria bacterium]MBU2691790.1 glutamate racemase [Candidatus Eisenbacteria bacterium]
MPIGVFDSGIGGLSVVRHILCELPDEGVLYFGDSARVPYGTKSAQTVIRFSMENTRFLLHKGVKFLVVACNTSSAVALPELSRSFDIPIVGMIEPAVRQALRMTQKGTIGVIGTRATIASEAYTIALRSIEPSVKVISQACPLLVPLAEEGWVSGDVPERVLKEYLEPVMDKGMDVLILGCTHYPLLKETIRKVIGPDVAIVESGEAAVVEMSDRLRESGLLRPAAASPPDCHYYVSDIPLKFKEVGERFLGCPLGSVMPVDQVDIPWYER